MRIYTVLIVIIMILFLYEMKYVVNNFINNIPLRFPLLTLIRLSKVICIVICIIHTYISYFYDLRKIQISFLENIQKFQKDYRVPGNSFAILLSSLLS